MSAIPQDEASLLADVIKGTEIIEIAATSIRGHLMNGDIDKAIGCVPPIVSLATATEIGLELLVMARKMRSEAEQLRTGAGGDTPKEERPEP